MAVFGLCVFIKVMWAGLQSMVVAFSGHSHLPIVEEIQNFPLKDNDHSTR